jgi:hypothetical protein
VATAVAALKSEALEQRKSRGDGGRHDFLLQMLVPGNTSSHQKLYCFIRLLLPTPVRFA